MCGYYFVGWEIGCGLNYLVIVVCCLVWSFCERKCMFVVVDFGFNSFCLYIGKYEDDGICVIKSVCDFICLVVGIDKSGNFML